jgi:Flp pilus assembly protein TadD
MHRVNRLLLCCCVLFACRRVPPPHPRALENNELCAQYIGTGDLYRAEVHCDLAAQFSPDYSDVWVNKGLIALKRGQTDPAKENFIKAIRLNQEQAQGFNNLGYIYLKEQQLGKAHDQFQRALKVNPDYLEARYNLALTFKSMGNKAAARKEYNTILAVNPNIADAHADLGIMALDDRAFEEAISELTKATRLDPRFTSAWENLGVAYMEAGRYNEARDAFTSCLEVDSNNIPCRNNVTLANRKLALLDPTLREIQETDGTNKTAPQVYQDALTFRDKGLRAEEERYYKKCVKLDGRYAPCHFGLHILYKEDHKDQEAIIACKNFLRFAMADEFPKEVSSCEKFVSQAGN